MRKGRRLALDVGSVRIGVATSDNDAILASPLEALDRIEQTTITSLLDLIAELEPIEIYIGDPTSLSGQMTKSTVDSRIFASELAMRISVPVLMIDERLTTVSAAAKLRESGKNSKLAKPLIDSASAVEILEFAMETERVSGKRPGVLIGELDA